MTTKQYERPTPPTAEDLIAVTTTTADFVSRNPLPEDTSLTINLRNYDGQNKHPMLRGFTVSVDLTTSDGSYAEAMRAAVFGTFADEPEVIERPDLGLRFTAWHDTHRCRFEWAAPLTAEVSA